MIPICDPIIGDEEEEAVLETLRSGMIAGGPKVEAFEQRFAEFCDVDHAVAVNSGTAALHSIMNAIGISDGDEVITTPFTFVSTPNSVLMEQGKPVFADIKPDTYNIDPEQVEDAITAETKAILPVDLYGQPHSVNKIREIADEHDLYVITDAAQSVNAAFEGQRTGSYSDACAFSFYATKNMTSAEGGMVTTDDEDIADAVRRFRKHGYTDGYHYDRLGYNYAMSDVHAAIGLNQLDKIKGWTEQRRENARELTEGIKRINGLKTPFVKDNVKHCYHQYTIRVTDDFRLSREELQDYLEDHGVDSKVYYPMPLHLSDHVDSLGYEEGDLPVAEKAANQVVSLPVHPNVTQNDIKHMIKVLNNV